MGKELWSTVTLRNKIMNVAEAVAPLFKERKTDEHGNHPRYISVKNVEFIEEKVGDTVEFDVEIEFLSDIGFWIEPIIIRFFTSYNYFEEEIITYQRLRDQLSSLDSIRPNDLISIDDKDLIVIYEGAKGKNIEKAIDNTDLYHFQLGVLAAYLHSAERLQVDIKEIKAIADYLLYNIPFPKKDNQVLSELVDKQMEKLIECYAGYQSKTIFDTRLIYLNNLEKDPTKSTILLNEAYDIQIIYHQPQDAVYDRMGDVASIYAESAINEYLNSKNVDQTTLNIIDFLEGYESVFERSEVSFMDLLYPNGLTLDLHMLLGVWLIFFYQLNGELSNVRTYSLEEILDFSYYLCSTQPFNLFK